MTVLRSDQLDAAQDGLRLLRALPIVLVVLSLLLFAVALFGRSRAPPRDGPRVRHRAHPRGRRGARRRGALGDAVVDAVTRSEAGVPAAEDVWTIATPLLVQAAGATIFYGAVLLLGAWLGGPTRPAVAVRRAVAPYVRDPLPAYARVRRADGDRRALVGADPRLRNPVTAIILVVLLARGFEALRRSASAATGVVQHHIELGGDQHQVGHEQNQDSRPITSANAP